MDVGHTDNVEAKAVDLRETRRRFLLAREEVAKCSAEQSGRSASCATGRFRNGAQVLSSAPETASPSDVSGRAAGRRPMPTESDMLTLWTERI
jgi:hypothetical protein